MFDEQRHLDRVARREARREARLQRRSTPRGRFHSVVIGALLATFGLTLLATNLGWTDMRSAMQQFWPFALVIWGIANLISDRSGVKFWGVILIVAGLWVYADQRDWIHVQFWAVFGPTV